VGVGVNLEVVVTDVRIFFAERVNNTVNCPWNVKLCDVVHRAGLLGGLQDGAGAVVEQPDVEALFVEELGETWLVIL